MTETNRYGQPLKTVTLEEVIRNLLTLSREDLAALCAALIITHQSKVWPELFNTLRNDKIKGGMNGK